MREYIYIYIEDYRNVGCDGRGIVSGQGDMVNTVYIDLIAEIINIFHLNYI